MHPACLSAFLYWVIVAIIVAIPYAVLQFNLFFPNSLLKSVDSGLECTGFVFNDPLTSKNKFYR